MKQIKAFLIPGVFLVIILGIAVVASVRENDAPMRNSVSTFYPLQYAASQIGGNVFAADSIVPNGVEPHDFEPSPRQIQSAAESQVFIYLGAGFDPFAERISDEVVANGGRVVEAAEVVHDDLIEIKEDDTEVHEEDEGEHGHEGADPHIWLDPVLYAEVVRAIRDEMISAEPDERERLEESGDSMLARLEELDQQYATRLSSCELDTLVTAHDAFGYLAARYGFEVASIARLSPDDEPSAAALAELTDLVQERGISVVFFESLSSPDLAQTLAAEAGVEARELSPLEGLSDEQIEGGADYFSVMRQNLDEIAGALRCE